MARQADIRQQEAEIRQREREVEVAHEEEMAMIHKEAAAVGHKGSISEGDGIPKVVRSPPLLCFNEHTDSTYLYLQRFERYTENRGWEEDNYAVFLSALLKGHALEVYSRSPFSERLYPVEASHVRLVPFTLGDFRKTFYACTIYSNVTMSQFFARKDHSLIQCIKLSNIDDTFEGLKELVMEEQILFMCPRELSPEGTKT